LSFGKNSGQPRENYWKRGGCIGSIWTNTAARGRSRSLRAARYDGAKLRTEEEARDRAQQVRIAELRRRFVDGPVLTMPAPGRGTSDTTGSVVIPGAGTVFFHNFTQSGQWGRLEANGGVLRSSDGATLSVPVTGTLEGISLKGDGWSATLNSGWAVRPAVRLGSFLIVRAN
jgi:hypothetical protein